MQRIRFGQIFSRTDSRGGNMEQVMPYFMENEAWYVEDENDGEHGYKLTKAAPQKAVKSYKEFYDGDVVYAE